jgi:hypothetical protein
MGRFGVEEVSSLSNGVGATSPPAGGGGWDHFSGEEVSVSLIYALGV